MTSIPRDQLKPSVNNRHGAYGGIRYKIIRRPGWVASHVLLVCVPGENVRKLRDETMIPGVKKGEIPEKTSD
jgi:hypothetical protein